jgi:exonuclease SbcC
MIKSLEISNFQSHKDSAFEFSDGVNVITGSSDSGKSSVIRSLIWILKNRPTGDSIKNWDASDKEDVSVALEFDNGWITKKRTKTKSQYLTEDGIYEALRSDVPEEIQKISNITDFNLQTQHQPYFLLQDSPGEVARKLNDLVGVSVLGHLRRALIGDAPACIEQPNHGDQQRAIL